MTSQNHPKIYFFGTATHGVLVELLVWCDLHASCTRHFHKVITATILNDCKLSITDYQIIARLILPHELLRFWAYTCYCHILLKSYFASNFEGNMSCIFKVVYCPNQKYIYALHIWGILWRFTRIWCTAVTIETIIGFKIWKHSTRRNLRKKYFNTEWRKTIQFASKVQLERPPRKPQLESYVKIESE